MFQEQEQIVRKKCVDVDNEHNTYPKTKKFIGYNIKRPTVTTVYILNLALDLFRNAKIVTMQVTIVPPDVSSVQTLKS
jgi:hypothetical protein